MEMMRNVHSNEGQEGEGVSVLGGVTLYLRNQGEEGEEEAAAWVPTV